MKIDWAELEDFCRYRKSPPLSDITIATFRRTFNRVYPFIAEHGWTAKTTIEYMKLKRSEGIKSKSLNVYRKLFRLLDLFLGTECAQALAPLPEEDTDFDVITFEEKEKIVTCEPDDFHARVDSRVYSVLYLLLSEMALRISEALSLKWSDYKGDYITVYSTKTNRFDDLLTTKRLQGELNDLQRTSEYIFPVTQQCVNVDLKKRVTYLGINKRVSTHTFRRSFATVAIEQGIQRDFVQQRMRHRNSSSLDKYIRKSKRHQREVLQRHPFTVDSMSQEDKVSYIRGKQRELEDEMRRLGVTGEMLSLYK